MKVANFEFNINDNALITKSGIYIIKNNISNKVYVGQTRKLFIHRWLGHQYALSKTKRSNVHLQNSFNKYGKDAFEFDVLEYLPNDLQELANLINQKKISINDKNNKENIIKLLKWLNDREHYWICYYKKLLGESNVYNEDESRGKNPTKELRELRGLGVKRHYENPYAHIKQSKAQQLRYSRKEEHEKISKAVRKSIKENPERLRKQGNSLKRFYENEVNRINKSKEIRERYKKPEEREKISRGNKKRFSDINERIKMSESQLKSYKEKPERKLKQSKALKNAWKNGKRKFKPLTKESYKKISETHKQNVKDPIKYKTYLKNAINAVIKRTNKYALLRLCADNALLLYYNHFPKLRKLSVKKKWELINDICEYLKTNK